VPDPAEKLAQPESNDETSTQALANGHPPNQTPFPRMERTLQAATAERRTLHLPEASFAGDFQQLLDARRHVVAPLVLHRDSGALREMRQREKIYRRGLVLADAIATSLSVLVAIDLLGGYALRPLYLLVVPLVILAAKVGGLYDRDERVLDHSTMNELPRLLNVATTFALVVWLARHYVVIGAPTTVDLLMMWVLLMASLIVARSIARRISGLVTPVERCMVIGRPEVFERVEDKLRGHRRVELAGHLDAADIAADHALLRKLAERVRIHRVIIDTDAAGPADTLETVRLANASGLQVSLLPSMLGAVGSAVAFDDIGGLVLMGVPRFGLSRSSLFLKRAFDVAGATAILVLSAPLMAMIAVAIKLDSSGPVLFRQTRMGRNDRPFRMLKFRSMIADADALKDGLRARNEALDGLFKIDTDPRVTRVGRLLRRYGIDELPQFFNVLGGSMSIVGPRPLVIDEDRHVTGFDRQRLHLTPGITGRWQTLGASRVPLSEMVKIDYLYIANWSPWVDLRIIIDTVVYLVRGRGQ
jgi:exopolysaccharide biosynthesis polyprenyl glycosylphosphotransferase